MVRRLEAIRATGRVRAAADHVRTRPSATAAVATQIRRGPGSAVLPGRATLRRVRRYARNLILRVMRPFTTYQHRVDLGLVAALDELSARIVDVRRTAAEERARMLAALRQYEQLPSTVEEQRRAIEELERRVGRAPGPDDQPS